MIAPLAVEILGQGPALLMLHGAGGSPRDNFPFLDELAREFTVIAPSLPGVGDSELGDRPLDAASFAKRVRETLDLHGFEQVAVCGYSMGTTVAVHLAASHGHRVSRVALSAGFTHARPSMRSLVDVWAALLDGPAETLGRFILGSVYRPETLDQRADDWITRSAGEIGSSFPRGTRAHLDLLRTVDTAVMLASTTQPMLVVVPEHDGMVHPGHSEDLLAARPDAQRVGLAASHPVGAEVAEGGRAALLDFFRS